MDLGRMVALAYKEMWQEWNNYYGRTDANEYWGAVMIIMFLVGAGTTISYVAEVFFCISLVPLLAMTVRRLNDSGTHWAWLIPCLIPVAGWILFLYLTFKKSLPWITEEDMEQAEEDPWAEEAE